MAASVEHSCRIVYCDQTYKAGVLVVVKVTEIIAHSAIAGPRVECSRLFRGFSLHATHGGHAVTEFLGV